MRPSVINLLPLLTCLLALVISCDPAEVAYTGSCENVYARTEIIPGEEILYLQEEDALFQFDSFVLKLSDTLTQIGMVGFQLLPCPCDSSILLLRFPVDRNRQIGLDTRRAVAETTAKDEDVDALFYGQNKRFPMKLLEPVNIIIPNPELPKELASYESGKATEVALIDSGVDAVHDLLQGQFWQSYGRAPCDRLDTTIGYDFKSDQWPPEDEIGHGTHLAGIVLNANLPKATYTDNMIRLMNLKITSDGTIDLVHAMCAINFAARQGVNIVNLSWGYYAPTYDTVFYEQLNYYPDILFVASAGNDSLDTDVCRHWPSSFSKELDHVISVGALDLPQADRADFSNVGNQTVHLLAPGTDILSSVLGSVGQLSPQCGLKKGTSQAAAYVTRLAAIVKQSNPKLGGANLKQALFNHSALLPVNGIPLIEDKKLHGDSPCEPTN